MKLNVRFAKEFREKLQKLGTMVQQQKLVDIYVNVVNFLIITEAQKEIGLYLRFINRINYKIIY